MTISRSQIRSTFIAASVLAFSACDEVPLSYGDANSIMEKPARSESVSARAESVPDMYMRFWAY
jgi:hypothetical protein